MSAMRAMVLDRPQTPLVLRERSIPQPAAGEILIEIEACGVCRTDLHVVDGELPHPKLPIVPGHEIVGRVAAIGAGVTGFRVWRARRRAVARCDLRRLSLLPFRARELVRFTVVHGLYARRRLCDAHARRCAFCLSAAGETRRRGGGAAALRRPDRLAQLPDSRGGDRARPLRLRRRRAYFGAGRHLAGPAGLRLHPRRRRGLANIRALARRSLGRRFRGDAAGTA